MSPIKLGDGSNYRMLQLSFETKLPEFEIKDRKHPFDSYIEWYRLAYMKDQSAYNQFCLVKAFSADMQLDRAWELAIKCPEGPLRSFFMSWIALHRGDLALGYQLRESRFRTSNYPLDFTCKRWDGKPTNEKIFVWQEGGYGDVIQYSRYLHKLLALCPNASCVIDQAIYPLIEYNFPEHIMPKFNPAHFEGQCSMMSLPFLLQDFEIDKRAYFQVSPDVINKWHMYRGKVGFIGKGNPAHSSDRLRSLTPEEIDRFTFNKGWVPLDPAFTGAENWLDTAGIIMNLDLVVTVDTAIGHLAGALGRPVWVLMNKHHDWRWSHEWYESMRVFKCKEHSDWEPVFQAIEKELSHGKEAKEVA